MRQDLLPHHRLGIDHDRRAEVDADRAVRFDADERHPEQWRGGISTDPRAISVAQLAAIAVEHLPRIEREEREVSETVISASPEVEAVAVAGWVIAGNSIRDCLVTVLAAPSAAR